MNKWNCLIVDDEPIALEILASYCQQLSSLKVLGLCGNALEAREIMQTQTVDILFIDINMPILNGLAFIKTLKRAPQVIFTTAYKEYAVDAFDLSACDYLLKPFSLDRFILAVDKATERLQASTPPISVTKPQPLENYFFLRADGKIYKVLVDDVLYAEANGNYTKIVTSQGVLSPVMTFTSASALLPAEKFIQSHRSFIVNKSKMTHIEGNRVFIGEIELPIGSNYRERFLNDIGL